MSGVLWIFLAEFFFYLSGYVVHMFAGRILGPEEYGRYGLVITATLLVANLIGSGIPIAMSKYLSEARAKHPESIGAVKHASARIQCAVMAGVTLLFALFAYPFATVLGDPSLAPLFLLSSLIIPLYAADSFYFYFFSGTRRMGVQSGLKFFRAFLRVTVIVGLGYIFHLQGMIAGYMIVPLGVFLLAWGIDVASRRGETAALTALPKFFSYRKLLRLALPTTAFLVVFEVLMSFDLYFLKSFFSENVLTGEYNAALTIARIPSFLFYALTILLLPAVSESLAQLDPAKTRERVGQALRFMLLLLFPFVALLFSYPESLLAFLFGDSFRGAAHFLPVLGVASSMLALLYVLSFAFGGAGKMHIPLFLAIGTLLVNMVLDAVLFRAVGAEAVSWAKLVSAALLLPPLFFYLWRQFQVSVPIGDTLKALSASILLFLLASLGEDSIANMLLISPVLLALYGGVLMVSGVVRREDWNLVLRKKYEAEA